MVKRVMTAKQWYASPQHFRSEDPYSTYRARIKVEKERDTPVRTTRKRVVRKKSVPKSAHQQFRSHRW